jgi:hypothetical protein
MYFADFPGCSVKRLVGSSFVEAWFPGGKDDPNLLMLRMDLGDASIWAGELGVVNCAKMMLGLDVTDSIKGGFAEVNL